MVCVWGGCFNVYVWVIYCFGRKLVYYNFREKVILRGVIEEGMKEK